jgi:ABC-2 type transport system permease protein
MRKTWVFFKLRIKQMKYDKLGLFFSYVFPVILLLGIGYPVEKASHRQLRIDYVQSELGSDGQRLVDALSKHKLIELVNYEGDRGHAESALHNNEIQHLLLRAGPGQGYELRSNSLQENRIAAVALASMLDDTGVGEHALPAVRQIEVPVSRRSSYLAVLLPGVIAMTLLVIGLSGFGSVLIGEESQGLYKNLKSIDVSPIPFFTGLFMSRMLVAYSVAFGMFLVSVLTLGVSASINFPLLFIVISLGAAMFLGIGLAIFLISPTHMAFNGIASVVQIPLILLGGVFFSVATFPNWLRLIAEFSPLAPFTSALRGLMFGGVGFGNISELLPSLAIMGGWVLLFLVLARFKFRW